MGLKIIPLGGLGAIGMNITALSTKTALLVVDCGLSFPGDRHVRNRLGYSGCVLFKTEY